MALFEKFEKGSVVVLYRLGTSVAINDPILDSRKVKILTALQNIIIAIDPWLVDTIGKKTYDKIHELTKAPDFDQRVKLFESDTTGKNPFIEWLYKCSYIQSQVLNTNNERLIDAMMFFADRYEIKN